MEVIDSNERKLSPPEIIIAALINLGSGDYTPQEGLAAVAVEIDQPNTDLLELGNTVFIGHRGTGKSKHKMWGRGLTVDTAQNFISAGLKYFTHLQELGITQYITEYDGAVYDSAFKTWKRYGDRADTKIAVGRLSDGNSKAFVELGVIPLSKVM